MLRVLSMPLLWNPSPAFPKPVLGAPLSVTPGSSHTAGQLLTGSPRREPFLLSPLLGEAHTQHTVNAV